MKIIFQIPLRQSYKKPGAQEGGFTIVELMMALVVLSVILLMSTVILIQIGALYSKGVNAAALQNTTRNLLASVSSNIQFGGDEVHTNSAGSTNVLCIGKIRYTYLLNTELGEDSAANPLTGSPAGTDTPHVLWQDTMNSTATCNPLPMNAAAPSDASSTGDGREIAPEHTRITRFSVQQSSGTGVYSVDVWMAFGDSDLVQTQLSGRSTCANTKGTQFCSVSELSTVVKRRLNVE